MDDTNQQYQDILNKYAAALNNPPAETPKTEESSQATELSQSQELSQPAASEPVLPPLSPPSVSSPSSELPPLPPTPPVSPPPIKIVTPDIPPSSSPSEGGIFKIFFFVSLIVFLCVVAGIVYSFVREQKPQTTRKAIPTSSVIKTTPTSSQPACELNDKKYNVGESFAAADGCNTCTCLEDLTITCTENDCSGAQQ